MEKNNYVFHSKCLIFTSDKTAHFLFAHLTHGAMQANVIPLYFSPFSLRVSFVSIFFSKTIR